MHFTSFNTQNTPTSRRNVGLFRDESLELRKVGTCRWCVIKLRVQSVRTNPSPLIFQPASHEDGGEEHE